MSNVGLERYRDEAALSTLKADAETILVVVHKVDTYNMMMIMNLTYEH